MRSIDRIRTRGHSALLLAFLIIAAYGDSLWNGFVYDDVPFMTEDRRVQSLDQVPRLLLESRWRFRDREGHRSMDQYYRPLEPLPYVVSHVLFGGAAWPSHLMNLLLHFGNCLLVLAGLRRLLRQEAAAVLGASLFAVHPAYSETVLWVAAHSTLGAFACAMAMLLLHTGAHGDRWYVRLVSALLFFAALGFKETGILAPMFLAFYDLLLPPDRGWTRLWRLRGRYAVFLPPFLLYGALRVHALDVAVPGFSYVPLTTPELILNAVALVPQYVTKFLWPVDLNLHHDFSAIHDVFNGRFWLGAGLLLIAAAISFRTARAQPVIAFAIAWAMTAVAPYLLVHVPNMAVANVFAERYLYDPAFGVVLLASYGWTRLVRRYRRIGLVIAVATLAVFTVIDARRTLDWRDEETLYSKTLTQSARAEVIRENLAVRLLNLDRYDEGIAVLTELLAINPDYRSAWYNLGVLYQRKGMTADAIAAYEKALHNDPTNGSARLNLGYLYDQTSRHDEALQMYFRLVDQAPRHVDAWYNLAVIAFEHRQYVNAGAAVERVLALAPDDRAAAALRARLDGQPARPRASGVEDPATLRRCAEAKRAVEAKRYDDAVAMLQAAAWLDEASPLPHQYLANLYVLTRRRSNAMAEQREALQRAPGNALYRRNLEALEAVTSDE